MFASMQVLDGARLHQAQLIALPRGRAGTVRTLELIVQETRREMYAPQIRELALRIVADVPERDVMGEAAAVQRFVRESIRYVRDSVGREVLQSPMLTLKLRQGDCDDHTSLIMALLGSLGHVTRATAIGLHPGRFQHVFPETLIHGRWVSVEATEEWPLGYTPPGIVERMSLALVPGSVAAVGELGGWFGKIIKKINHTITKIAPLALGVATAFYAPSVGLPMLSAISARKAAAGGSAADQQQAQAAYEASVDKAAGDAATFLKRPDLKEAFKQRLIAAGDHAQAELDKIIAEGASAPPASSGNQFADFVQRHPVAVPIGAAALATAVVVTVARGGK